MSDDEEAAMRGVLDALDYFMATSPRPRGMGWRKVQDARNRLSDVRAAQDKNDNPFALGR